MPGNPSAITTTRTVDAALAQSAGYRLDANDRQYIDNQIRGCEQQLVSCVLGGVQCTYVLVDASSVAVAVGDVVCLSGSTIGVPTVTRAVSAALTNALSAFGVAINAASPGAVLLVAIDGVVSPTTSGLAAASGGVRVNGTTARCERVAVFAAADYVLGTCDAQGYMNLAPSYAYPAAGGGAGSVPTGSGVPKIVGGVQQAAAALIVDADVSAVGVAKISGLAAGVATFLTTPSGANLASALTAALPVSKGGTNRTALGTGLQVLRTNAGATDTEWATLSGGGATSAGATSGQVQTGDGIGGFTAPTGVLAGAGFVSIGTAPSLTGAIRLANGSMICGRNVGGSADIVAALVDSGNSLYLGCDGSFGSTSGATFIWADTALRFGVGTSGAAANLMRMDSTGVQSVVPIVGSSGSSSPYGVHGAGVFAFAADANYVVTAAQYALRRIAFSQGSWTIGRTVTYPAPASDAAAYGKTIKNNTAVTMTISTGVGATKTLATGLTQNFWFDATNGVQFDSPTF